jgi:phosphinothricin acetyltransferase
MEGLLSGFGISTFAPADASGFFEAKLGIESEIFGIWVAHCEGRLVGWQGLQPCRNNPIEGLTVAESSTYISSTSRGKGVGSALLEFAQKHAARVGLKELRGDIATTNLASVKLVEGLGWRKVGTLPRKPAFFMYAYAVPAFAE